MAKIAIIDGNFTKNAEQPIPNVFINGELQKRIEEFSKKYNVKDIKPVDGRTYMIIYD